MKKILALLFVLAITLTANASHIVGGEVYYDSLGNDQYRVTFEIYRDCSGAAYDNPLTYTVFNADGSVFSEFNIALPVPDTLPIVYDDPCVTPPSDICIERAVYVGIITLPATANGYYITYQRCCWAANILNITQPGDWGITITTYVPGTTLIGVEDNNCARYNNYPPIVLCSGQTLDFDHSATDIDGDSLVYSMCTPLTVNIGVGAMPNPEAAQPYADVPWEVGFSGTVPYGAGSNVTIDSQTGMMSITPNAIGTYVAAVCVEEWRDGVLINTKSRTFGYRVVVCDVIEPMQVDVLGAGSLIEDCQSAGFIVHRDDSTDAVDLQIFLSGQALNGVDYNFIPDTLTLPINVGSDTILITPTLDGLLEGNEDLVFSIVIYNICEDTYDTTTAFITIVDYINMGIEHEDSINVCDEANEWGMLWCHVGNGVPPYNYIWYPTNYANNDTIVFPATDLPPNLTYFYVEAYDQCGKMIPSELIKVYNHCPLVPPNVITANMDGTNDEFIIKNVEDYDRVHLIIFNRWGNVVYENEDYQNDWTGLDMKGKELSEGVYTYVVTPESIKYVYDDQEITKYTAHGFVHIIRD